MVAGACAACTPLSSREARRCGARDAGSSTRTTSASPSSSVSPAPSSASAPASAASTACRVHTSALGRVDGACGGEGEAEVSRGGGDSGEADSHGHDEA